MTTNEYIRGVKTLDWPRFGGQLRHRNYHDRFIRTERSRRNIAGYILDNPLKWEEKYNRR